MVEMHGLCFLDKGERGDYIPLLIYNLIIDDIYGQMLRGRFTKTEFGSRVTKVVENLAIALPLCVGLRREVVCACVRERVCR